MKFLYIECIGGISGDMLVGSLLDGLVPFSELEKALNKLPLDGYRLELREETRHHISGKRFIVHTDTRKEEPHRHLDDIRQLLVNSSLSEYVTTNAIQVFERLAQAEAQIHATTPDRVHFHEVGAVDSIVDIVSTFICLEYLQPQSVYHSPIPMSRGYVDAAHGKLPVPAPATLALLKNQTLHYLDVEAELVTPTGAALIAHISQGPLPTGRSFQIQQIGYGLGSRDLLELPNFLRVWLGEFQMASQTETALQIETNIDDLNPEVYPYLMERLFECGVQDVSFYPNIMKKGRPGVLVSIICDTALLPEVRDILFTETSTIGFRYFPVYREKLPREVLTLHSPWGNIQVKKVIINGRERLVPEFEECKRIARISKRPLWEVYQELTQFLLSHK
ncbi:MAG: nickel pincer cofactor biosynthesis protein LarC [Calditrichaeota bacterium]|nr:nickel pincer cofactor biosynthesis protein LarC [Calditrichota bacterium]